MKRTAGILSLFLVCSLLCTACTAKSGGNAALADSFYEPATSAALPATVACDLQEAASFQTGERPNSAFITVDESLQVKNASGIVLFQSLDGFLESLSGVAPGLYVQTDAAAGALAVYLKEKGRQDVIVAAQAGSGALVRKIRDSLPAVRGLMDFSGTQREMTPEELGRVAAETNAAGAKIALLSYQAATRQAVRYLQSRLITVWARADGGERELLTQLTNGVNGLMAADCHAAYAALSFFKADVPVLLRAPLIIGHRGLASEYTENTLRSEQAAQEAGADMLEYDIYLSADGELFVTHDETLERLFNRPDVIDVESLTLKELQAIPFDNDSSNGVQKKNHTPAKDSPNGSIFLDSADRIPSLREIFEAFRDTDVIHMVEIKSQNPETVGKLKALAAECGVQDKINVISFNVPILKAMAAEWPEMSLGCLGYDDAQGRAQKKGAKLDPAREVPFANHAKLLSDAGGDPENALLALNEVLGPYNGNYDPSNAALAYDMLKAGRHLGVTAWPWTYNSPDLFAKDYLFGMYGLTTNFSTWASGLPKSFTASDAAMAAGETLALADAFAPMLTTYQGGAYAFDAIEAVPVSDSGLVKMESGTITAVSPGTCLMLLRVSVPLMIGGKGYGAYYVYSNPVTLTVE